MTKPNGRPPIPPHLLRETEPLRLPRWKREAIGKAAADRGVKRSAVIEGAIDRALKLPHEPRMPKEPK